MIGWGMQPTAKPQAKSVAKTETGKDFSSLKIFIIDNDVKKQIESLARMWNTTSKGVDASPASRGNAAKGHPTKKSLRSYIHQLLAERLGGKEVGLHEVNASSIDEYTVRLTKKSKAMEESKPWIWEIVFTDRAPRWYKDAWKHVAVACIHNAKDVKDIWDVGEKAPARGQKTKKQGRGRASSAQ